MSHARHIRFLFIRLKVSPQLLNQILETLAEVDRKIVYFEYFDFESAEYKP